MIPLLEFDGVTLSRGGGVLFEDLSFAVNAGEALRIAGPNGSGKSSLIRLAAGLLRQERGRVARSPLALADDALALDPELPLARALRFWGDNDQAAMGALGLSGLAHVPVRLLSSGQAKRAALARVVGSGAPLWLLDEPLNALDAQSASRFAAVIQDHLARGGAVVAASHQPLPGHWQQVELGR